MNMIGLHIISNKNLQEVKENRIRVHINRVGWKCEFKHKLEVTVRFSKPQNIRKYKLYLAPSD